MGLRVFHCSVYLTTLSHVPNDTNVAGTNGMEPWPLDALYATVTYAAQNLMNLVPEDDRLHHLMLDDLHHLHDIDPNRLHVIWATVDRLHQRSFDIIGAAMKFGPSQGHPWLSEAQKHQAILAHAVEYLHKNLRQDMPRISTAREYR